MENPTSPPPPRTKKRRGILSKLLRFGIVALALVVVSLLAAPYLLRTAWLRDRIAREVGAAFGSDATFGECAFSWTSGVLIRDLKVANPAGFPTHEPWLELAEARGGISWSKLLVGTYSLDLHAKGLQVRVLQREDGKTNVEVARDRGSAAASRPHGERSEDAKDAKEARALLAKVRLDVTLEDSALEIRHATRGVLEQMRGVRFQAKKDLGEGPLRVAFGATLSSGRVEGAMTVDPNLVQPMRIELASQGLALERYRPIADAFLPTGALTTLGGNFVGNLELEIDPRTQRVRSRGKLRIDEPRLGGGLLRGAEWKAAAWTLEPNFDVTPGEGVAAADFGAVRGDLGFATFAGLAAPAATSLLGAGPALGCSFRVDLARLAELGTLVPETLRGSEGVVTGELACALPARFDAWANDGWRKSLRLVAHLGTARARIQDHVLEEYGDTLSIAGGVLTWSNAERPAKLDGGTFALALRSELATDPSLPSEASVRWNGGTLTASAIPVLQYFVPLLAGLAGESGVDFQSTVDTTMKFRGPLLAKQDSSVLEWLDLWAGDGDLHLVQGGFTPSRSVSSLLDFAGIGKRLTFDRLGGKFELAKGFVATTLSQVDGAAAKLGMRGRTSLAGKLEYWLDVSALLQGHRDGEKIRRLLAGKPLEAGLTGTLTSPSLAMPDLGKLILEGAASDLQKGQVPGLLDELFGKKKKKG